MRPLYSFQKQLPKIIFESSCFKIFQILIGNTSGGFLFWLQSIDFHIYRNWIMEHNFYGILKQFFHEISAIGCCNQKQSPEVFYKKAVLKNFATFTGNTFVGVSF